MAQAYGFMANQAKPQNRIDTGRSKVGVAPQTMPQTKAAGQAQPIPMPRGGPPAAQANAQRELNGMGVSTGQIKPQGQAQGGFSTQNMPQGMAQTRMGGGPGMQTPPPAGYQGSGLVGQGPTIPASNTPQPGQWDARIPGNSALQNPFDPITGTGLPGVNPTTGGQYNGLYNISTYADKNSPASRYIENVLPLLQFQQNQAQYNQDFNEGGRRWDTEMRWNKERDMFNMGLSEQQQKMAEWQAQQQANQWGRQFGHTQQMDIRGAGQRDTELANQFRMGMDQNQATRDVASTYGGAQRYGADREAQASMYGSDKQLAGANVYANAQRYGSDREFAATQYQWDMQNRMNQAQMQNNLQVANVQAYGRNQAPGASWASSWA